MPSDNALKLLVAFYNKSSRRNVFYPIKKGKKCDVRRTRYRCALVYVIYSTGWNDHSQRSSTPEYTFGLECALILTTECRIRIRWRRVENTVWCASIHSRHAFVLATQQPNQAATMLCNGIFRFFSFSSPAHVHRKSSRFRANKRALLHKIGISLWFFFGSNIYFTFYTHCGQSRIIISRFERIIVLKFRIRFCVRF